MILFKYCHNISNNVYELHHAWKYVIKVLGVCGVPCTLGAPLPMCPHPKTAGY